MALKESEFKKRVRQWQEAEPGELASHFIKLTEEGDSGVNFQFVKAGRFDIVDLEGLQTFQNDLGIDHMYIWMSLKKFKETDTEKEVYKKTEISFEPILQVTAKDEQGKLHTKYFEMIYNPLLIFGNSEKVPTPFVENTSKLWREQPTDQLADMFTVQTVNGLERVRFYKVDGDGLRLIKQMIPTATGFSIIAGLDLNKSVNAEETLFIPIINVQAGNIIDLQLAGEAGKNLHGVGLSILEDGDGDGFFDYAKPCPPFCGND